MKTHVLLIDAESDLSWELELTPIHIQGPRIAFVVSGILSLHIGVTVGFIFFFLRAQLVLS